MYEIGSSHRSRKPYVINFALGHVISIQFLNFVVKIERLRLKNSFKSLLKSVITNYLNF